MTDIQTAFPNVAPQLLGDDIAYPAMLKFLPPGFLGVMVGSLIAAYMSTMDTHLNWGASYLVHDLYRRFMRRDASERHYVLAGRLVTCVLMIIAAALVYVLQSAKESFDLMLSIGAGTGLIYLLRWFWWRINAWSEIAAMISSFLISAAFFVANKWILDYPVDTHKILLSTVGLTTLVWVLVTLVTPAAHEQTLTDFYKLVRPFGPGWRHIAQQTGIAAAAGSLPIALLGWVLGCVFVYAGLFGTGQLLYGNYGLAGLCAVFLLFSGCGLAWLVPALLRRR